MSVQRERGAAMLLTFLAIVILVVVVGQLSVSSSVDRSIAVNALNEIQYDYAAAAALHVAQAMLIKDSKDEDAQSGEDPEGEGGDGSPAGDGGTPSSPTGSDPFGSEGGGEGEAPADSLNDEWADDQKTQEEFGDVRVRIRIIDEDRKLNLLCLVAEDEEFREQGREQLIRLLDVFREDSRHDLSPGDAADLVDGFEKWLRAERDDDFPLPAQSTDVTEESKLAWSESKFKNEPDVVIAYPLGLDELVMVEGMTEFLLRGFNEDGRYVPGLEDVVTIFSNVRIDADALGEGEAEEEDDGSSPAPIPTSNDEEDDEDEDEEEQDVPVDEEDETRATETNQGRVNINTAPLAVLRALIEPEDLPFSVIEKVDEFRREIFSEDYQAGLGKNDNGLQYDNEDEEKDEEKTGLQQEDEDFIFRDPQEVIDRVEQYYRAEFNVQDEVKADLARSIAVKSNVFTVIVEVRNSKSNQVYSVLDESTSKTPPDRLYRSVVWRRKAEDGKYQCITLIPMHTWRGVVPPDDEEYRKSYPFGF